MEKTLNNEIEEKVTVTEGLVLDPNNNDKYAEFLETDFTSDDVNLDELYDKIKDFDKEEESENVDQKSKTRMGLYTVIETLGASFLEEEKYKSIIELSDKLYKFSKKYDSSSEVVKDMSESEKDKIFAMAKFILSALNTAVNDMHYDIHLDKDRFMYIFNTIKNKVEYTGNEMLLENLPYLIKSLSSWNDAYKHMDKKAVGVIPFRMSINNLVLLYHFLSKHSVKGFVNDSFSYFFDIMNMLKNVNDLHTSIDNLANMCRSQFINWVSAIDEVVGKNREVEDPRQEDDVEKVSE